MPYVVLGIPQRPLTVFPRLAPEDAGEDHTEPGAAEVPLRLLPYLLRKQRPDGQRVTGTTTVRALEGAFAAEGGLRPGHGFTELFIVPGFHFNVIDGLITNFHLPKSTLLLLVSALASRERILTAYQEAVEMKYRFYSYGDAMLILPRTA